MERVPDLSWVQVWLSTSNCNPLRQKAKVTGQLPFRPSIINYHARLDYHAKNL
jgi:hypothetical protein